MTEVTEKANGHRPRISIPPAPDKRKIVFTPPKFAVMKLKIVGTAPYLQCAFGKKAQDKMIETQAAGTRDGLKKRKVRPARNFEEDFQQSLHHLKDGGHGIPAGAFRQAAKSACRLVDFNQQLLKATFFVVADGYDAKDGTPLVRIHGTPKKHVAVGRNSDMNRTADIRVRGIFEKWHAIVTIRFDEAHFDASDIVNLMSRIGLQIGIGEGRPDSKSSMGMDLGTFEVKI